MLSSPDRVQGRELPLPQEPGLEARAPRYSQTSLGVSSSVSHIRRWDLSQTYLLLAKHVY